MSTHKKRALILLAFVVVTAGVAFMLKLGADADNLREARAERRAILAQKLEARHLALRVDDERLAKHAFFAPTGEGDAGPLLLKRAPWGPAATGVDSILPDDEIAAFGGEKHEWLTQESHPAVAGTDLTWFAELAPFAFWDWDALDGPRQNVTFPDLNGPIPNVVQLIALAKIRMLQGLKSGDIVPAAREVRNLARLLYSSEHLLGAVGAFALLRIERAAVDDATRRGLSVEGVTDVFTVADIDAMKHLVLASTAAFGFDPVHRSHAATVSIGRCVGLNETLQVSVPMRLFLNDRYAARFSEIAAQVEGSGCRLPLTRRALTTAAGVNDPLIDVTLCMAFLPGNRGRNAMAAESCELAGLVRVLPQARASIGEHLLSAFDDVQFVRFLEGKRELTLASSPPADDMGRAEE